MKLFITALTILITMNSFAWIDKYSPNIKRNSISLKEEKKETVSRWINWSKVLKHVSQEVHSCDLNKDGKIDYIVNIGTPMNGLWSSYSEVTFILSSPVGYKINKTGCMGFEVKDIIEHEKNNYYIMTAFCYWSSENGHNYWTNRLYSFGKDGKLKDANKEIAGFPFFIWYTFKENHKPTTHLSDKDKNLMWENAKENFIIIK